MGELEADPDRFPRPPDPTPTTLMASRPSLRPMKKHFSSTRSMDRPSRFGRCAWPALTWLVASLGLCTTTFGAPAPVAAPSPEPLAQRGALRDTRFLLFAVRDLHADWWHPTPEVQAMPAPAGSGSGRAAASLNPAPTGAALCCLDFKTGRRQVLVRLASGDIRGWQLDHANGRLVLSMRRGGPGNPYQLAEFDLGDTAKDGQEGSEADLRPLTSGPFDDIDPDLLADGSIVFASTRGRRWDEPGEHRVFTLYQCAADGSEVRPFSDQETMQREPRVLPDGRVLFGRQANNEELAPRTVQLRAGLPDGTPNRAVNGTGPGQALSFLHTRSLPSSGRFVTVAVPWAGLTRECGWLAIIDPARGPDQPEAVRLIGVEPSRLPRVVDGVVDFRPEDPPLRIEHPELGWRYPYPLTDDLFLALTDRAIWLVGADGRTEMLYEETELPGELASVMPMICTK